MRIESKLCHISENKAVVQVNGWLNDKNIGSALGEGITVELAEDNAISRLKKRLTIINEQDLGNKNKIDNNIKTASKVELPINDSKEKNNVTYEPNDWSNELAAIDTEMNLNNKKLDEVFINVKKMYKEGPMKK